MRISQKVVTTAIVVGSVLGVGGILRAFQDETPAQAPSDQEVTIKREAVNLTPSEHYRVGLQLVPVRSLDLTAPIDGVIRSVSIKTGQKGAKESEAVRIDDARVALVVKRAKANLAAAKIEKKLAKSDADKTALAEARIEAAQAELDLAQIDLERTIIRNPFAGEVHRVYVVEGQYVRAGDKLATIADVSHLQVEIPVDRETVKAGGIVDIKVEDAAVRAKVEAILPLNAKFNAMRDLSNSVASALVDVDNPQGKMHAGQTVYVDLIPLAPVASVPTTSVTNQADGHRKVQVLRDNVVRSLPVRIHGKIGTERVFVSGGFLASDELVLSASRDLADGTPVRALLAVTKTGAEAGKPAPGKAAAPAGAAPKAAGGAVKKKAVDGF